MRAKELIEILQEIHPGTEVVLKIGEYGVVYEIGDANLSVRYNDPLGQLVLQASEDY